MDRSRVQRKQRKQRNRYMWEDFLKSFLPLFVAFDVLGVLPLYAKFSINIDEQRRNRVLRESIVTAFLAALGFIVVGRQVLQYLGISIADFLVAGGAILFILAAKDLVAARSDIEVQGELFGVVPLGVPLLAGPAVFATSLIIYNSLGFWYVLLSLVLNLCVCGIVFRYSHYIVRLVSRKWLEALSKVFALILASIAIMFIRTGLASFHLP